MKHAILFRDVSDLEIILHFNTIEPYGSLIGYTFCFSAGPEFSKDCVMWPQAVHYINY